MYVYVIINLCFRNHTESKAAFNDEITMKDYYVLCLWGLYWLLNAKKESFKMEFKISRMSVFKDTAKVYVQFFEPK